MSEAMLPTAALNPADLIAAPAAVRTGRQGHDAAGSARVAQAAKDFESVLLHKVLQSMKDTIGDWGLGDDAVGKQTRDLFWMYLARELADQGGLGLWKQLRGAVQRYEQAAADGPLAPKGSGCDGAEDGAAGILPAAKEAS